MATDPTSTLVIVDTNSFGSMPLQGTPSLPKPYSTEQRPNLVSRINFTERIDTENLPPIFISDPEDYNHLQDLREEAGRYPIPQYEAARSATNPYEKLGNSIFFSRAAVKLANIDALYKLTEHIGAYMNYTTPLQFKFADLAGGPGAFTQYIQWRRDEAMGYGMTLKGDKPGVPDWNITYLDPHRFLIYYGDDGSGNLYTQWRSLVDRIMREQPLGLDLVTGDAAFDIEAERAFRKQEFLVSRLILVQLLTALKILRIGGNLVIKVFDTVTELTAQILWIASLCFEKITLLKPISSRPANSEKYLICQGKRKNTEKYELILEQANGSYNQDEVVISLIDHPLPNDFTQWLTSVNDISTERQTQALTTVMDYLKGGNPDVPVINIDKALVVWNIPSAIITRKSLLKIKGSGRGVPFSTAKDY